MAKGRKFAVLAGMMVCMLNIATAQNPSSYYEEDPHTFFGGLIAGANFTQVDGDSYAGYHKVGLTAGGIVYTRLAEHLAVSLEILFSQKGSRGHRPQESGNAGEFINKYRIDLNYAEVPILLNYFDKRRSHFGGGFSYSQLVSSDEVIVTNLQTVDTDPYKFRKMDINLVLSGQLHLWKGLFAGIRFQYSLVPIRKGSPPGFGRSEQFNNIFGLRMMYLF